MNLAQKWRPQTINDFSGQTITIKIIEKLLKEKKTKNVMLFAGNSGCGKTTLARIVAKEINGPQYEPMEVDGASAGGVDSIRLIVESANQRDLVGEYKVIIIDECQMLGGGRKENSPAWTALLKCIEECPKYTIFIFCTTDPDKIPTAVLNRMQRFNFAPISNNDIYNRLCYISQCEGFTNFEQVCDLISRTSNGCMRQAIQNLERCADYSTALDINIAKSLLSGLSFETMFKLTWAIQNKKEENLFTIIDGLVNNGQDLKSFVDTYLSFILDLTKFKLFNTIDVTNIPAYLATGQNTVVQFTVSKSDSDFFNKLIDCVLDLKTKIQNDTVIKSTITAVLLHFLRNN